ncbi:MAG: flagellar hook-basal body protein [Bacillota bacterium]
MLRGLDLATAGMLASQRWHDTISNNIANINTVGFKAEEAVMRTFPEYLIWQLGIQRPSPQLGSLPHGVLVDERLPLFQQGTPVETGQPLHVAIVDDPQPDPETGIPPVTFFAVQRPDGTIALTRAGQWTRDARGQWVTPQGYRVMGYRQPAEGQAPVLEPLAIDGPFQILSDGRIVYDNDPQPDVPLYLAAVTVDNPYALIREGDGLWVTQDGALPEPTPAAGTIRQGFLEQSNVDPARSMVNLMLAGRAYEANQRVIQAYDRTLDKAVNEVGRL